MKHSFAHQLINRSLTDLSRVVVVKEAHTIEEDHGAVDVAQNAGTELLDTLVLTLDGVEHFELVVRQGDYTFEHLSAIEEVIADFILDPDEVLTNRSVTNYQNLMPFLITSITDVWAGYEFADFLAAVVLWGQDVERPICLVLEGDEASLVGIDGYNEMLSRLPRQYGVLTQHWYQK